MAASFLKRASYYVANEDDLKKVPDVKTAIMLLKSWGLDIKGLRTRDQAIQRLLDHWNNTSEEQQKKSDDKINRYLNDTSEKLKVKTELLVAKFESMIRFYKQLSSNHQKSISDYENIEETVERVVHQLKHREIALVIAGEIGSGQTSLINLLLQTDILPVEEGGCTKTFCVIKQGTNPQATLCSRIQKSQASIVKVLDLTKEDNKAVFLEFITSSSTTDEMVVPEKVVVEFPFQFLESNIYLLDVPDTIDSSVSLEAITSELSEQVIALYVLDVSKPNEIQTGKVEEFIQQLSSMSKLGLTCDDVMVICNKCDLIPEDNLDEVKQLARKQLVTSCPELQENHIAFISVKQEQQLDSSGIHSEDFQQICKDIHKLFLRKAENRLIQAYRWLSQVQKRSLYTLKVSKLNSNKTLGERREMMAKLEQRIDKFEGESKLIICRLHEEIEMEIDRLFSQISDYLKSTELKSALNVWFENQCPKPAKKWKNVKSAAENSIADRLRQKLDEWEQTQYIKEKIKKQIINKFSEEVELMEDQIKKIGAMLACGDSAAVVNLHRSFKRDSPESIRTSPPRAAPSRSQKDKNRLGEYICSIGGFDKKLKKEIKPIFKKYKKENCLSQMFKVTEIYINHLVVNPQLKEMVAKYVKRYSKEINKIAKMIPDLIAMDKQLMNTLEAEVMETKETMFVIPENLRRCLILQGELDLFYVYELMQLHYKMKDIEWNEKKKLGVGTFAVVHPGILKTNDGLKIEIAIKVFKDPLQVNTISELLLEDETLRELDHENIIRYYGATIMLKGTPEKTYWVMIMASCLTNLKDVYLDKKSSVKEDNPGKTALGSIQHENAKTSMIQYVIQICSGIQYLHSKKLVHRDLKLENILVTEKKEIKLTDVGLTKPEEDISGTLAGSPVYMAPEVHEQKTIYNHKADIYSLSMILWEMWYGESINDHLDTQVHGRLSVEIRKGKRPLFKTNGFTKPPDTWVDLLQKCWHNDPKSRPKAYYIKEFFTKELETNTVQFV